MSIFIHEQNIKTKVKNSKGQKKVLFQNFYGQTYLDLHRHLMRIKFDKTESFKVLAKAANAYLREIDTFCDSNDISSQSKFRSSFLEELSEYMFKDLPAIKRKELGFFNKGIFAGMKIGTNMSPAVITKDVDFCIGKKVPISIGNDSFEIIMPIIAVEVKTYLDATMFGEVQHSSGLLKNAIPNVKTYVLMEYNRVANEKIIAARHENNVDEMFALRLKKESEKYKISAKVLQNYYDEVVGALKSIRSKRHNKVNEFGKLLDRERYI